MAGGVRLRGRRPWADVDDVVVEQDQGRVPVGRQHVRYDCPAGHAVVVAFAALDDVEVPPVWPCSTHGTECGRHGVTEPDAAKETSKGGRAPRTPWDMLLERRTLPELEALLEEALVKLRGRRLPARRRSHPEKRGT